MCGKCQDRGFIEENHGLIVILCDCEKGKEYRAQREAILGIPKEAIDDNRTEPDNTDTGSPDTSEPKQPSKPKKKKKTRKRAK